MRFVSLMKLGYQSTLLEEQTLVSQNWIQTAKKKEDSINGNQL